MKVTIDGITYEGTPAEIRDIVENPPRLTKQSSDCPDNDRWNHSPSVPPSFFPYHLNPPVINLNDRYEPTNLNDRYELQIIPVRTNVLY